MKYVGWIIGLFAAAVGVAAVSRSNAYVLLVYPPYRIELSMILFAALCLMALAAFYVLVRITHTALNLPAEVRQFREQRHQAKTRGILDEVLSAYFEGRYAAAEKAAVHAMETGETSALHPIIAARAAHELHEFQKRDGYLAQAQGKSIGDTTLRLMSTTKFMLDQRNPRAALSALHELQNSGVTQHVGALSLELKAQQ
jgi:HemY protein